MDEQHARALVAGERRRIEAALAELTGEQQDEDAFDLDQTGESAEAGAEIQHEMLDSALAATLQNELAAVVRAEARIVAGTFGLSVESGARIPDDRLEAEAPRRTDRRGAVQVRAKSAVADPPASRPIRHRLARPTGVGHALTAYRMPIEGRDEWLAAARRLA